MNGMFGLFWMLLLLAIFAWAAGATASGLLSRFVFSRHLVPGFRLRRAAMLALLPWLGSIALLAGVMVMALGKAGGWVTDHCAYHGPSHPHFCFEHLPAIHPGVIESTLVAVVLVALAGSLLRFLYREWSAARYVNRLLRLSSGHLRSRVIDDDRPVALAAGWLFPVVLLSRGLRKKLDRRERRIVIAHEFAHLRGGDLAANLVFECLLLLHLPRVARCLRREWRQALEERADDRVVEQFGREDVASTLLKVLRLQRVDAVPGLAVSGADAVHRIERLLSTDESPDALPFVSLCLGGVITVAVALASSHHLLETLLGFVTGH